MQSFQQQPQLFSSQYQGYHSNNHLQKMQRSSKSVSKYVQTSSMLYSPHKRFEDETLKNNLNNVNSREYQQTQNIKSQINYEKLEKNMDNDQTKNIRTQNNMKNQINVKNSINYPENNLGRVISKLQTRLQGAEVKITSLTNVVKLLQKYSQTKDDQYQKQKQNILFSKNVGERVQQIESLEIQNKIKEFNAISKQMKREIQQVTQLKMKYQANLTGLMVSNGNANLGDIKKFHSNKSKKSEHHKSPTSQGSYLDVQDLAAAFQDMQQRLRDQINKKMQICLRQIKKISSNTVNANQISGVDQNLFEQQINALNFAINKVENQCTRNKMVLQNQIEEIMNRLSHGYLSASLQYLPRKFSNLVDPIKTSERQHAVRDKSRDKSRNKSHSRKKSQQRSISRDKSKSNMKSIQFQQQKLLQKKRVKEEQLREAIRRKRQTKERLKSSKN